MLRFIDGVAHYATKDLVKKWNNASPGTQVEIGTGRFGGNAIRMELNGCVQKTLDPQQTWIVGFAIAATGFPVTGSSVLCQMVDGPLGVQLDLRVNPDSTLSVTRNGAPLLGGTSTAALRVGSWHFLELKAKISNSIAAGDVQVQLDGVQVISVTAGQSVQATANTTANMVVLKSCFVDCLFCDVYICDGTAPRNNTFLGDCRVVTLFPAGPGASTQFSVTGAGANWIAVSENPPDDDESYVSSNIPGQIDLYTLTPYTTVGTIKGVQTVLDAAKDNAGVGQIAAEVRTGGVNYVGATVSLGTSYVFQTETRELNPKTGLAWTQGDLASLQIGVNLIA